MTWHVYIIRTRSGALYTGIATDVGRRLKEHEGPSGRGAKYLRSRGPLEVVYTAEVGGRATALGLERSIKALPKRKKEALVATSPSAAGLMARFSGESKKGAGKRNRTRRRMGATAPGIGETIVSYRPELRADFERLNRIWLDGFGLMEDEDLKMLSDPEAQVLATGGDVFFALEGTRALGTCAAIRLPGGDWELAKLAVAPEARGRGLGRALSERAVRYAREAGGKRVVLTSNHLLKEAIRLYESMGFRHEPMPADVRYETADVYMVLDLRLGKWNEGAGG